LGIKSVAVLWTQTSLGEMNSMVISACGGEWVFQKVEELNGLFSNVYHLFSTGTTQDTVSSCFQYCALTQECNVVITTNSECYCSEYPTNDTYSASAAKSTVDRKVYFKRPVRGKWFIISVNVIAVNTPQMTPTVQAQPSRL
jgi:hypothetical protein